MGGRLGFRSGGILRHRRTEQADRGGQAVVAARPELGVGRRSGRPVAVGLLSAPVPEDAAEPSRRDADTSFSSASYSSISRPAHAELGKTFDVASTRRRPVVFEEDDDLDVPDFLK